MGQRRECVPIVSLVFLRVCIGTVVDAVRFHGFHANSEWAKWISDTYQAIAEAHDEYPSVVTAARALEWKLALDALVARIPYQDGWDEPARVLELASHIVREWMEGISPLVALIRESRLFATRVFQAIRDNPPLDMPPMPKTGIPVLDKMVREDNECDNPDCKDAVMRIVTDFGGQELIRQANLATERTEQAAAVEAVDAALTEFINVAYGARDAKALNPAHGRLHNALVRLEKWLPVNPRDAFLPKAATPQIEGGAEMEVKEFTLSELLADVIRRNNSAAQFLARAERYKREGSPAWKADHVQGQVLRWRPDYERMPGIGRIEILCRELFQCDIDAESIKNLRARLCSQFDIEPPKADEMTLDEVADAFAGLQRKSSKPGRDKDNSPTPADLDLIRSIIGNDPHLPRKTIQGKAGIRRAVVGNALKELRRSGEWKG